MLKVWEHNILAVSLKFCFIKKHIFRQWWLCSQSKTSVTGLIKAASHLRCREFSSPAFWLAAIKAINLLTIFFTIRNLAETKKDLIFETSFIKCFSFFFFFWFLPFNSRLCSSKIVLRINCVI